MYDEAVCGSSAMRFHLEVQALPYRVSEILTNQRQLRNIDSIVRNSSSANYPRIRKQECNLNCLVPVAGYNATVYTLKPLKLLTEQ